MNPVSFTVPAVPTCSETNDNNTPVLGVENDSISLPVQVTEVNLNLSTIPADSSCSEAMIEDPIIISKKTESISCESFCR